MRSTLSGLLAASLLAGCAHLGNSGLVVGQSTGAEVVAKFGQPANRVARPDGGSVLYYPGGPMGHTSYAVVLRADGKLQAIEQRLTDENFAKIMVGTTTAKQVLELLGPSFIHTSSTWQGLDVWEYKLPIDTTRYVLWVQFSQADGIVRSVAKVSDPEWEMGRGSDSLR